MRERVWMQLVSEKTWYDLQVHTHSIEGLSWNGDAYTGWWILL